MTTLPYTPARKVTQFQDIGGAVRVLCDDGSLWSLEKLNYEDPKGKWIWKEFPPVPQPE